MKILILNLLILLTANTFAFADEFNSGIALSDISETRRLNTWIRNNTQSVFDGKVEELFDSNHTHVSDQAASFVRFVDGTHGFIVYYYNQSPFSIDIIKTVPLDDTDFRIDIDLSKRQLVATDRSEHNLKFLFPIAPGGFSLDLKELLTPVFKKAYLDRRTIISKRTNPSYFKGKPFLRVMTSKNVSKGWTGIGLHIKQNYNLKRSYESHGCIRLRGWDLDTLHAMTRYRKRRHTELSISLQTEEETLHPHPMISSSYNKVKSFPGGVEKRDEFGLLVMERIHDNPRFAFEELLSFN